MFPFSSVVSVTRHCHSTSENLVGHQGSNPYVWRVSSKKGDEIVVSVKYIHSSIRLQK